MRFPFDPIELSFEVGVWLARFARPRSAADKRSCSLFQRSGALVDAFAAGGPRTRPVVAEYRLTSDHVVGETLCPPPASTSGPEWSSSRTASSRTAIDTSSACALESRTCAERRSTIRMESVNASDVRPGPSRTWRRRSGQATDGEAFHRVAHGLEVVVAAVRRRGPT